jgi:hypothetical protein
MERRNHGFSPQRKASTKEWLEIHHLRVQPIKVRHSDITLELENSKSTIKNKNHRVLDAENIRIIKQ